MRTFLFFLFVGIVGRGSAQKLETPYLLDSFSLGAIYYKTGENREASLNFHRVTQEVVIEFNEKRVPIPDFSKMDSVDMDGHVFVFAEGRPMEILLYNPVSLYADHKCTSQLMPNAGAFGVKSHSTKVVTEKRERVGVYTWQLDNGYEIKDRTVFWLVLDDQWNKFGNVKQLGQLFSAKKKLLKKYADEHDIDFGNSADVREIVSFAVSNG